MVYRGSYFSKFGEFELTFDNNYIIRLDFVKYNFEKYLKWCLRHLKELPLNIGEANREACELFNNATSQLNEYFDGKRTSFQLPLKFFGTEFQRACWQELINIPYGETRTYLDIAARLNSPRGARAVGGANNKNPIPIIVPCHRVIGKNGELTGYRGGLNIKEKLLELEREL